MKVRYFSWRRLARTAEACLVYRLKEETGSPFDYAAIVARLFERVAAAAASL